MTHYSESSFMCRVDFFKPSGKWKYTEAIDLNELWMAKNLAEGFEAVLLTQLDGRMQGLTAVCLEPFHPNPYPQMLHIPKG